MFFKQLLLGRGWEGLSIATLEHELGLTRLLLLQFVPLRRRQPFLLLQGLLLETNRLRLHEVHVAVDVRTRAPLRLFLRRFLL